MRHRHQVLTLAIILAACSPSPVATDEDAAIYAAVLLRVESVTRVEELIVVHPAMLPVNRTTGWPAPSDRGDLYAQHPTDAIRVAVGRTDRYTVCALNDQGTCVDQPRPQTIVIFSAVDWGMRDRPRTWVSILELLPEGFGQRTFEVRVSRSAGSWIAEDWQLTVVEN